MGLHSARPSSSAGASIAGRTVFTAAAAFALVGGSAGMAFAGNASDDSGSGDSGNSHSHSSDHHWGHDAKWDKKHDKCEIPIVDPADKDLGKFLDKDTDGGYSQLSAPLDPTVKDVHDTVCPPLHDILGPADPTHKDDSGKTDTPDPTDTKLPTT